VLGIETSCDDTAAAVLTGDGRVLSNVLASQAEIHGEWGGVKPDAAQAAHQENIDHVVDAALRHAGVNAEDLMGIAATVGPGLSLCLQVGCRKALSIAAKYQLPVVAVHHMEAHAMVTRLPDPATGAPSAVQFPALILLVSGGHNMLVLTRALGDHTILGNTFDDSVGEAFDKTARLLGIDAIPGGPQLERMAAVGDPTMYANDLTVPLSKKHKEASYTCDFSYAGLKTNVRLLVEAEEQRVRAQYPEEEWEVQLQKMRCNVAACFQHVAVEHLVNVVTRAVKQVKASDPEVQHLVVAGGVAANRTLHARLQAVADAVGWELVCPPLHLCTDNGVMVAWTGVERLKLGLYDPPPPQAADLTYVDVRPRWPMGQQDYRSKARIKRR